MTTADDIIKVLGLVPHPEGGHFTESFRDAPGDGDRAASTAIYLLLRSGELSRWHHVDAVEVFHWYAGAPLELSIWDGEGEPVVTLVGSEVMGDRFSWRDWATAASFPRTGPAGSRRRCGPR